jgi:hypothetical protein
MCERDTVLKFVRCRDCGEVIGVYEPLVVVEDGEPRSTSFAAEPSLGQHASRRYHRACFGTSGDPEALGLAARQG